MFSLGLLLGLMLQTKERQTFLMNNQEKCLVGQSSKNENVVLLCLIVVSMKCVSSSFFVSS